MSTPREPVLLTSRMPTRDPALVGPTTWLDAQSSTQIGAGTGLGAEPRATFPPLRRRAIVAGSPYDVCQGGVVLRTVLFVHGVIALGMLYRGSSVSGWLTDASVMVAAALPATLVWLLMVCACRHVLQRWPVWLQWGAVMAAGAACATGAWAELAWLGQVEIGGAGRLAGPATGAALAAAVFHWLRQRARLSLPAGTQARLAELQSRIRPHFLFNALNSAITLVQIDPGRAEGMLEDLAELFRAALVGSGEQVTLDDEVELAQRYLAIEQVRFGDRLKVSWLIDPATRDARVPSLVLQPLVENAVKHGVEPSPEGGEIRIRSEARHGQALITITNTVPEGRARNKGQGMALRNVRERLHLLHDLTMRFEVGLIEGGRFRVRIAIPLPR